MSEAWPLRLEVGEDRPHVVTLLEPNFWYNLTYTCGVGLCVRGESLATQETNVHVTKKAGVMW